MDELLIRRTTMLIIATLTTREAISVLRTLADGSPEVVRILREDRNRALIECSYLISRGKPSWRKGRELSEALEYFVANTWHRKQNEVGAALQPGLNGLMTRAHVLGVRGVPMTDRGLCKVFDAAVELDDEPIPCAA